MKSEQKIIRVKLKDNPITENILIGIVSADPDYKLSLSLNKKFGISLKTVSPVEVHSDESVTTFSRFDCPGNGHDWTLSLVSNRSGKNFLLKKLKNIDYIVQIHNSGNENNIERVTAGLREIDSITAIFRIDLKTLKDKNLSYLTH